MTWDTPPYVTLLSKYELFTNLALQIKMHAIHPIWIFVEFKINFSKCKSKFVEIYRGCYNCKETKSRWSHCRRCIHTLLNIWVVSRTLSSRNYMVLNHWIGGVLKKKKYKLMRSSLRGCRTAFVWLFRDKIVVFINWQCHL